MSKIVWVCGQLKGENKPWEFQGVFSTEACAIEACKTTDYFIGPAEIDVVLPHETTPPWKGAYYPLERVS